MDIRTLEKIAKELSRELSGRRFGKAFQLSRTSIAVDLHLPERRFLYINIEPGDPRIYLIERRFRDLEKGSGNPSPFLLSLKKYLSHSAVESVERLPNERILRIALSGTDEIGRKAEHSLIVQLTGRSANIFLLDSRGIVIDSAKTSAGEGRAAGDLYSPPKRTNENVDAAEIPDGETDTGETSISRELDEFYIEKAAETEFRSLANAAKNKLTRELAKKQKLAKNLADDLSRHGDAEKWKHFGDVLLANAATAKHAEGKFTVVDYFDENLREIDIPAEENATLIETAEHYFRRYTKARNAKTKIAERLSAINAEIETAEANLRKLDEAIAAEDRDMIETFAGKKRPAKERSRTKTPETHSGTRRYFSSDGFEILVGKKARDNDVLTFRTAGSLDTWLHAADYPGSHVIVRNPNRKEIPQRTLLEAAKLAAFYSSGKSQPKAAVHYTQKKFVNKPKGAAPGLVRLASFKTILVEPEFPAEVSEDPA